MVKTYNQKDSCNIKDKNLLVDQNMNLVSDKITGTSICAYKLSVKPNFYKLASISIWFEVLSGVEAYVLLGSDTFNVYNAVQLEAPAFIGAPFIFDATNGTTVYVFASISANWTSGSLQFSYKMIDALEYSWYDLMFVGKEIWVKYLFWTFISLALFVLCCVFYCLNRKDCRKK